MSSTDLGSEAANATRPARVLDMKLEVTVALCTYTRRMA
jgi:hypothetical protein